MHLQDNRYDIKEEGGRTMVCTTLTGTGGNSWLPLKQVASLLKKIAPAPEPEPEAAPETAVHSRSFREADATQTLLQVDTS